MAGSTIPILSPDQKLIAFTRNNDLWLLNLKSMKATRATRVGQPQTREFASVYVLISLWSRDGRKILYQVEQGPTEDLEGATPALKPRKVSYGPFIYDVDGGTSSPVLVPGAVRAWLLGGDFVVKTGDFYKGQLLRVHQGEKEGQPLCNRLGDFSQIDLSPDGKRLLAGMSDGVAGSEIIEIDIESGKILSIAKGSFAEVQWPKYSPAGDHLSYLKQFPSDAPGKHGDVLVVDGQSVYKSQDSFFAYWIDEETFGLCVIDFSPAQKDTRIIVDRITRKERSPTTVN